jgi:chemotaxis signal transduction protein
MAQTRDTGVEPTPTYASLTFGRRKLLIPQNEIHSLEPVADIKTGDGSLEALGTIRFAGELWPVYSLTEDLDMSTEIPGSRRVCVVLSAADGYFGLLCDDVAILGGEQPLRLKPVPVCMRKSDSPVQALATLGGQVIVVSEVALLEALVVRPDR